MDVARPGLQAPLHADWIVPDWPAPASVRALCTTRAGGVSLPPYDSLNLGAHVGDVPARVAHNRSILAQALGRPPVFMNQVHSSTVQALGSVDAADGTPCADAAWTDDARQVCTVMVADCLPVLLCSQDGQWVAAAHAGWRGLAGSPQTDGKGILEQVFESSRAEAQVKHARTAIDLIAWLGPCIGPQAFEVGGEVRSAFVEHGPAGIDMQATQACFKPKPGGKWLADLSRLARLRLEALGVNAIYGNDGSPAWCTVSNPSRFFSHRRDGVSGRMAACIWRD